MAIRLNSILLVLLFSLSAHAGIFLDKLNVDNLQLDGNTLSTTNTNGDFTITQNGTGSTIFSNLTASTVPYLDASKKFKASLVTPTELSYLSGVTSAIQTQLNAKGVGTVTTASVASANGFAGTVANAASTPAITISTSITGMLKGNGTSISSGTAGTDYSAGTNSLSTGILKSTTSSGALSIAVAGDFPTLNQSTSGNAATATAFAANPTDCAGGQFATAIDASGNLTCATPGASAAAFNLVDKVATYNISATDNYVGFSAGSYVATLPASSVAGKGWTYFLCKEDASLLNIITLATTGGDTIGGLALTTQPRRLASYKDCYTLIADGVSDYRVASHTFDQGENVSLTMLGSAGAFAFTAPSATYTQFAVYIDATGKIYTVTTGVTGTTVTMGGVETPASTGTLTLSSALYSFTISSASVSSDCVYSNSTFLFTGRMPITSTTTWTARGTGNPASSGTLTLVTTPLGATCPATLTYSAHTGDSATTSTWTSMSASGMVSRASPIVDINNWTRSDATHACVRMNNSTNAAGSGGTGNLLSGLPLGMHFNLTTSRLKPWADQAGIIGVTVGTDQPASQIPANTNSYQSGSFCPGNGIISVFDAHSYRWSCIDNFGAGYLNVGPSYFADTASTLMVGFCAPIAEFTP